MKERKEFQFMENSLDVIRLFAALQVAITHYLNLTLLHYRREDAADRALLWLKRGFSLFPGVVILFAVSGFLMGTALEKQESRNAFLKKRFLRIYPGLWANILLTAAVVLMVLRPAAAKIKSLAVWCAVQGTGMAYTPEFLKNFGAGSMNGALWTIMVEVQFYLLIYLFWNFLKRRKGGWWIGMTVFSVLMNLVCWLIRDKALLPASVLSLLDRTFLPYLVWFCLGMLLYRYREKAVPAAVKGVPVFMAGYVAYKGAWLLLSWKVPGYYADVVTSLVLPVLVIGCAYRGGRHRIANDISYSIFLYHWPVINLIFHYGLPDRVNHVLLFAGYIAVFLILAMLSQTLVEKRFLKQKGRLCGGNEEA